MKKCTWCGKEYPDEAKFCEEDGQALEGSAVSTAKSSGLTDQTVSQAKSAGPVTDQAAVAATDVPGQGITGGGAPAPAAGLSGVAVDPLSFELEASPVWKKAAVSGVAVLTYVALTLIPLPTRDFHRQLDSPIIVNWTVMSLGLAPFISAFIIVELAALLMPAWRPMRVGSPAQRAKLRRAALLGGLALTVVQGMVLATGGEVFGVARPGFGFRLLTVITLLGAASVVLFLVQQVDRRGLGSGFSVLILASLLPGIYYGLQNLSAKAGVLGFDSLMKGGVIVVGMVAATLWMFSSHRLFKPNSGDFLPVRLPACGVVPLAEASAMLYIYTRLANAHPGLPLGAFKRLLEPGTSAELMVNLAASAAVAVLFSWCFNQPAHVAGAWQRFTGTKPATDWLKPAMLDSVVFIGVLVLGAHLLTLVWGSVILPVLTIVVGTAIILDMIHELRIQSMRQNLVPVWEIHQVYAVDPAIRFLASEGIQVFPRGVHHRTLLQFFGPYVPVHLLVDAEHAKRAQALLHSRYNGTDAP